MFSGHVLCSVLVDVAWSGDTLKTRKQNCLIQSPLLMVLSTWHWQNWVITHVAIFIEKEGGNFLYTLVQHLSFCFLQDLNIPVPPPASAESSNEPQAKRPRVESSEVSNNSSIEGTKVYVLPSGTVPCNKPLSELIHLVKPHIRELVEDSNLVWMLCIYYYYCFFVIYLIINLF